jgi:hypothetical protein
MTEPVRFFPLDAPRTIRSLREKLKQERDSIVAGIIDGAVENYAEYRNRVGLVRGLDTAIKLCDETEKELMN